MERTCESAVEYTEQYLRVKFIPCRFRLAFTRNWVEYVTAKMDYRKAAALAIIGARYESRSGFFNDRALIWLANKILAPLLIRWWEEK